MATATVFPTEVGMIGPSARLMSLIVNISCVSGMIGSKYDSEAIS